MDWNDEGGDDEGDEEGRGEDSYTCGIGMPFLVGICKAETMLSAEESALRNEGSDITTESSMSESRVKRRGEVSAKVSNTGC